jgi:hypothetical protein
MARLLKAKDYVSSMEKLHFDSKRFDLFQKGFLTAPDFVPADFATNYVSKCAMMQEEGIFRILY